MCSVLASSRLSKIDWFGNLHSINDIQSQGFVQDDATFETEFEHYSQFYGPFVGSPSNQNMSGPHKELLLRHWNIGYSMYRIQELTREIV